MASGKPWHTWNARSPRMKQGDDRDPAKEFDRPPFQRGDASGATLGASIWGFLLIVNESVGNLQSNLSTWRNLANR
jgi:hypothetical protein